MRLSVDKNDPGYGPLAFGAVTVLFNGKPISVAVTADEEAGEIVAYKLGEDGHPISSSAMEILKGEVRILLPTR